MESSELLSMKSTFLELLIISLKIAAPRFVNCGGMCVCVCVCFMACGSSLARD